MEDVHSFTKDALDNIRGVESPLEKMQEEIQEADKPKLETGTIMDGINITPPDIQNNSKEELTEEQKRQNELLMARLQQIAESHRPLVREYKVGPNDPCPCGSGKKYKKCCKASGKYENLVRKK